LTLRLVVEIDDIPLMPVRRLQNYAYCPRLFYLQWVDGIFQENADVIAGDHVHRNVDVPSTWRDEIGLGKGVSWRSMELSSDRLGLHGVVDLVESGSDGLEVIDYKKGSFWRDEVGEPVPKPFDAVQVQAYTLLLRDNGYHPVRASIYYADSKMRVPVTIDENTLSLCTNLLNEARVVASSGVCPDPILQIERCLRCSAYPICLPRESLCWKTGASTISGPKVAPRPDGVEGQILVVQDFRARVGIRGGHLIVERVGEKLVRCPLEQVRAVNLYGAIQISAQALQELLERDVPIAHFSPAGRFIGLTQGLSASGVDARRGQYRLFDMPELRLGLAREVIRGKIHNQRTLMMRNGDAPDSAITRLAELRDSAAAAKDLDSLRGLEGAAASTYFSNFASMLKDFDGCDWDWNGRNRRPPMDPVNALLSLGYSCLSKELTGLCHAVGLDPFMGFFHVPRYGRPALALDLMEEFRPLVADSVAIGLLNRRELTVKDFARSARGVLLKDQARRSFWQAWGRRMDTEVSHPHFGYRMSYRRMMDVQVRQLWRFCRGECEQYRAFTTR